MTGKGRSEVRASGRDCPEVKAAELELLNNIRRQTAALAELGTVALRGVPLQLLMDKAMTVIAGTLDVDYCKILEFLPEQNVLLLRAGAGWKQGLIGAAVIPAGSESQAGYTLQTRDPVVVEDFAAETRFSRPQLLTDHGVVSGISIVIQGVAGPWGVLGIHTRNKRLFSQDDVSFAQTMSNILAEAIERDTYFEELRQSERKFRGLIETAPDGIVICNSGGRIEIVNKQLEKMTGYAPGELIGRQVETLVPARYSRHELYRRDYLLQPRTLVMGERKRDLFIRRKDGGEIPVEISLSPLETERGMIVSAVIRDVTEQKHAEQQQLESHRRLRNLAQRLRTAREEERTAVARDIHDELGQTLTRLKIDLSGLSGEVPKKSKALQTRIKSMIGLVETTIEFVRRLSTSLRPAILDDLGLVAAIEWQVQGFAARTGCEYSLNLASMDLAADKDRDTTVFRIFQEALTNIARHARASHVDISLLTVDGRLEMSIEDNGIGIEQQNLTDNQSLGLIGMQERAAVIGGEIEIQTKQGTGTRIILKVPLGQPDGYRC